MLSGDKLHFQNLTLHNGTEYAVTTQCSNRAGMIGESSMLHPLLVLLRNIVPGQVIDGFGAQDIDYQTHDNSLFFQFDAFVDPMKQPLEYEWAAGTDRQTDNVVAWQPTQSGSMMPNIQFLHGMALPEGWSIFVHVRASSGSRFANASSNGVTVVANKPVIYGVGIRHSTMVDAFPIVCNWIMQEVSQPLDVYFSIGTWPGGKDLMAWTNVNETLKGVAAIDSLTEATTSGDRVWSSIRVVDRYLGLETVLNNLITGKMYDITPPEMPFALPVIQIKKMSPTSPVQMLEVITASWSHFTDQESNIQACHVCLEILEPVSLTVLVEAICMSANVTVNSLEFA